MNDGNDGHDSPESAAMTGFPAAHCRVIASRRFGEDAYVLLDTGSPGRPYLYGVHCFQQAGRWFESSSSNGSGWEQTGHDPDVGTLSLWADVPEGVEAVRVAFDGALIDEPVNQSAYLLVWWRVAVPTEWPHVVAVRAKGTWTAESDPGLALRVAVERGHVPRGTA